MPRTKSKPDLLQWKRSERLARKIVVRYLTAKQPRASLLVLDDQERALVTMIAIAIGRARLDAPAKLAVRSAAGSASKRAGRASGTTRARAAASSPPRATTTPRTRVTPRS